jgi:hypothetical protein
MANGQQEHRTVRDFVAVAQFIVWCVPDSPVHPWTEGNQGLSIRAPMAPRSLGAIKGTPRCMELNTKHPLNILQHRDVATTPLLHYLKIQARVFSCNSTAPSFVLFSWIVCVCAMILSRVCVFTPPYYCVYWRSNCVRRERLQIVEIHHNEINLR